MPKIKFQERDNECMLLRKTKVCAHVSARRTESGCPYRRGDWGGEGGRAENALLFL